MFAMNRTQRVFLGILVIGLVFTALAVTPLRIFAQDDAPPLPPSQAEINEALAIQAQNEYTLADLGYEERTLNGPFDALFVRFGLPPDWQLTSGAQITLDMTFFYSYPDATEEFGVAEVFGGIVQVAFNGETLTNVLLDERGDRSVTVNIPPDALISQRDDGRHILQLELISDESCFYGIDAVVVVKPSSRLILPHQVTDISTDLALLPRPIYQNDSIVPEITTFVVPDQPTTSELNAALAVVAGFGRLTDEEILFSLVPHSGLTQELRETSHVVFVGKSSSLPELNNVALTVPAGSFTAPNGAPDDGILQLAGSPWNSGKAVFVVSGDTDAGVLKAAQAFSTGAIVSGESPSVARIAAVNPGFIVTATPVSRALADLGYETQTRSGAGAVNLEYEFYVPPGQVPQGESYFDLHYAHSALMKFEDSGVVVSLNGEPIGSSNLSEETAQGRTLRASMPAGLIRPGNNRLAVTSGLIPFDVCAEFVTDNLWFTVFADSVIQLPLMPAPLDKSSRILDLDLYPDFLSLSPGVGSVAFVLPENDPVAWRSAANIAFNMGDDTAWNMAEFGTYFGSNVPEDARQNHDLVIVGQAANLPIIAELSGAMPAPFDANSNVATLQDLQVTYRLPESSDLGYIELFEAPWNPERAVLAVLGSSPDGVAWAGDTISDRALRGDLGGDFAFVNGEQVVSFDTRIYTGTSGTTLATAVPEAEVSAPIFDVPVVVAERPTWILPAIAAALVLMVLIVIVAGISAIRKNR